MRSIQPGTCFMAVCQSNRRFRNLLLGLIFSFAGGIAITLGGFMLTILYLFGTRPMHSAGPFPDGIYLIAPGLGMLVALLGSLLTLRIWIRAGKQPPNPDQGRRETMS